MGGLVAALAVAQVVWIIGARTETTDNATVQTRMVGISSEVSGMVREVLVKEHQRVEAGAILMQLDTVAIDARLARARAELASAVAAEEAARMKAAVAEHQVNARVAGARGDESSAYARRRSIEAETKQAEAAVQVAQAMLVQARSDLDRATKLHGSLAAAQLDEARTRAVNAEADLRRAQAVVAQRIAEQGVADGAGRAARAKVEVTVAGIDVKLAETDAKLAAARVDEAKAAVTLAEVDRSRATITAPFTGIVERRRVEPGSFATAGAEHILLVAVTGAWVEANFKEAQVGRIAPGQPATVELDAFPNLKLTGHVESIGGATLSRTSLLQVGAGTGFARTAQRVPVTIVLDKGPEGVEFAAGLNATVSVRVKK